MKPCFPRPWVLLACCLSIAAGACSSTSVSQRLAPDLVQGMSFKKIVVLGLFHAPKDRKAFEDGIVGSLKREGCEAVPSYAHMEHDRRYSKEELARLFSEEGFDAVLVQKITGVEEERTVIPENFYWPGEPFAYSWYSYWTDAGFGDGLGLLLRGGYEERHDSVSVESSLFSLESEKPVWVARSETTRVKTVAALAGRLGPKLAKKLKQAKLIP